MEDQSSEAQTHIPQLESSFTSLIIARIRKENVMSFAHYLIKIIFIQSEKNRFFAFIETDEELSLIVDSSSRSLFPDEIEVDSNEWGALKVISPNNRFQLGEGPSIDSCIHCLSQALAKKDISIFYLSTSSADYILVPQTRLQESLKFGQEALQNVLSESVSCKEEVPSGKLSPKDGTKKHLLVLNQSMHFFSIQKEFLQTGTFSLIRLFFEDRPKDRFIAYVEAGDELSFLLDDSSFKLLNKEIPSEAEWRCFQMCDSIHSANAVPGIVANLSVALCGIRDRVLCMSSYSTDFIYVKEKDMNLGMQCLQSKFILLTEEEQ